MNPLNGPIPGENFTGDTKNYPWHRPPEFTDLDKAIDESIKKLMSDEGAIGVITMMQMGVPILAITDMFVTSGISSGKWTPDFALLLAGPVSHILFLMAKGYDIEPNLGIDSPKPIMTKSYFEGVKVSTEELDSVLEEINTDLVQEVSGKAKGFMGMAGTKPPVVEEEVV